MNSIEYAPVHLAQKANRTLCTFLVEMYRFCLSEIGNKLECTSIILFVSAEKSPFIAKESVPFTLIVTIKIALNQKLEWLSFDKDYIWHWSINGRVFQCLLSYVNGIAMQLHKMYGQFNHLARIAIDTMQYKQSHTRGQSEKMQKNNIQLQ